MRDVISRSLRNVLGLTICTVAAFGWVTNAASAGERESAIVEGCASTAADVQSFILCTAGTLSEVEAAKCFESRGKDCFGPNNALRQIFERNVVGPVNDLATGRIGTSRKSLWRQVGLPEVHLW